MEEGKEKKKKKKRVSRVLPPAEAAPAKKVKKAKKERRGREEAPDEAPQLTRSPPRQPPPPVPAHFVSLADRLNPNRRNFDAALKASWPTLPAFEKQALLEADRAGLEASKQRAAGIKYPFEACADDHCETSPDAYKDMVPLLEHLAAALRKAPAALRVYDPYFCAGAVKAHLARLGFPRVYNENEDCYARWADPSSLPPHDVVVTNPPYGERHLRELLVFAARHDRPVLMLMPDYVCGKSFYGPAFAQHAARAPAFLVPGTRYNYWTPPGLREEKNKKSHRNLALGVRTSPFASLWYCCAAPTLDRAALLAWGEGRGGGGEARGARWYGAVEDLPKRS